MKRKLIDIPEETFERLSAKAHAKGVSLKGYIEQLIEKDSKNLSEPAIGYGYRFDMDREPTDAELMAVMDAASESSIASRKESEQRFFDDLNAGIRNYFNEK